MTTDVSAPAVPGLLPGLRDGPVYLDYNSTTPVDPRVTEAMLPLPVRPLRQPLQRPPPLRRPAPPRPHPRPQPARRPHRRHPGKVVFTGSVSEADALAIFGTVPTHPDPGLVHVVTQATEHPAVLETCQALHRRYGTTITYLPLDTHGRVSPADLAAALTPHTALVSIMTANNETCVLQPIAELTAIAREHSAPFHTDAAQAAGKIPLDVAWLGVDLLTIAGHKLYAPKGIRALYVRSGALLEPLVPGGGQERGLRASTENVALAVALGTAADLVAQDLADGRPARIAALRDDLHRCLEAALPGRVHLNGPQQQRLPNTLNLSIDGALGHYILAAAPQIAASTGSACHSGNHSPSPVLSAMGLDAPRALVALRLSLGRWSTPQEI